MRSSSQHLFSFVYLRITCCNDFLPLDPFLVGKFSWLQNEYHHCALKIYSVVSLTPWKICRRLYSRIMNGFVHAIINLVSLRKIMNMTRTA